MSLHHKIRNLKDLKVKVSKRFNQKTTKVNNLFKTKRKGNPKNQKKMIKTRKNLKLLFKDQLVNKIICNKLNNK